MIVLRKHFLIAILKKDGMNMAQYLKNVIIRLKLLRMRHLELQSLSISWMRLLQVIEL